MTTSPGLTPLNDDAPAPGDAGREPGPAARPRPEANDDEPAFDLFKARPDDPPQIRLLRRAVIGMGVIILLMFIAVIGRLAYLLTRPAAPQAGVTVGASGPLALDPTAAPVLRAIAADIALSLPTGAKVKSHTLSGNRTSIHYDGPTGEGIMILDLETGRAISHVRISNK
jgi:hypothetical protein